MSQKKTLHTRVRWMTVGLEERTVAQRCLALLMVAIQFPLVLLIGVVDHATGHQLSLNLLYQVPVALAAWRGGFACGVLLSLAATATWHVVDLKHVQEFTLVIALWNGVIRFSLFAVTSCLLARLRLSLFHERNLARTDALTGAANGRTFYEAVYGAVEFSLRSNRPLTLVYFDLDDFKRLNDRYGHSLGDETLRRVTAIIHRNLRAVDVLARLGGDEFALLLPDTGKSEANALINRLHRLLSKENVGKGTTLSLSVGAATFLRPTRDIDMMVRRTDTLMYKAKNGGKNRVEHEVFGDVENRDGGVALERRAVARILCSYNVRVRSEGDDAVFDENARIIDISTDGIGLCLSKEVIPETLLVIEPLFNFGTAAILARIVWSTRTREGWLYGCTMTPSLTKDELERWLGNMRSEASLEPLETLT